MRPGVRLHGPHLLSRHQRRAVEMYATHGTHKAAAHAMGLSEQTIKNHLSAVYHRLGVTGSIEAFTALGWLRVRKWEDEPDPPVTDTGTYWTVRAR